VASYPDSVGERIAQDSLWAVEFSLLFCRNLADVADVYIATGCITRIAHFLVHALFALNIGIRFSDSRIEPACLCVGVEATMDRRELPQFHLY
jgi:hypothetical protein